jgi:hypothetical protein
MMHQKGSVNVETCRPSAIEELILEAVPTTYQYVQSVVDNENHQTNTICAPPHA